MRGEAEPGARPVLDLSLELSAHMLVLARVDDSLEAAHARLRRVLEAGDALECFRQNVAAQGGEVRVCDDPAAFLPLVSESMRGRILRAQASLRKLKPRKSVMRLPR